MIGLAAAEHAILSAHPARADLIGSVQSWCGLSLNEKRHPTEPPPGATTAVTLILDSLLDAAATWGVQCLSERLYLELVRISWFLLHADSHQVSAAFDEAISRHSRVRGSQAGAALPVIWLHFLSWASQQREDALGTTLEALLRRCLLDLSVSVEPSSGGGTAEAAAEKTATTEGRDADRASAELHAVLQREPARSFFLVGAAHPPFSRSIESPVESLHAEAAALAAHLYLRRIPKWQPLKMTKLHTSSPLSLKLAAHAFRMGEFAYALSILAAVRNSLDCYPLLLLPYPSLPLVVPTPRYAPWVGWPVLACRLCVVA